MAGNGITVLVPFGEHLDRRFGIVPLKYNPASMEKYVSRIIRQIINSSRRYRKLTFASIYFGGCDPSLLTLEQLYRMLQALYNHLSIIPEEQTIVTLPGAIDADKAKVLKELSFDQITIRVLNRHVPTDDFNIFRKTGFNSVGFEIYLPADSNFEPEQLKALMRCEPDHLYFLPPNLSEIPKQIPPAFIEFLPGHFARPGKEGRHLLNIAYALNITFGTNQ